MAVLGQWFDYLVIAFLISHIPVRTYRHRLIADLMTSSPFIDTDLFSP